VKITIKHSQTEMGVVFIVDYEACSAGFRCWGAWCPGVVGGPMCVYRIFRSGMIDEVTSISMDR